MADEFTFGEAVRERVFLQIGVAGPSGSGKTLSALKIARGLVGGDDSKIFAIDTEEGRMLHYACAPGEAPGPFKFKFRYAKLRAPFTQERYAAAVLAAEKAGAEAIIIDSMSHEHEGIGGMLEQHEELLIKMAGSDYAKRERLKYTAWIDPKRRHNKLVNVLTLQIKAHVIFCFRAKDKLAMIKNKEGKTEMIKAGWTAICSDRLEYEMTLLLMLPPNSRGVPDLSQPNNKINEAHRSLIKERPIDESLGKALAAWAAGGAAPAPKLVGVTVDNTRVVAAPPHDPETGEVLPTEADVNGILKEPEDDIFPPHEPPQPSAEEVERARKWVNDNIGRLDTFNDSARIDAWLVRNQAAIAKVHRTAKDLALTISEAAQARKEAVERANFRGDGGQDGR